MANKRITELNDIGTPANNDVIEIVDVSDTTDSPEGTSKKVQVSALGGGATPDLQAVTDEGATTTNTIEIDVDEIESIIFKANGDIVGSITNTANGIDIAIQSADGTDSTVYRNNEIVNRIDGGSPITYPLPTGASSQIATLADITGGVSDGDKGDITVSSSGTVWTIDNGVVSNAKVASGIDAVKIGSGNVSNTEFDYLDGVTSAIQTQLDLRVRTLLNDNVDSSVITGTILNSTLKSYLIPANTLEVGDTIDFKSVCSKTNGGSPANSNFRLYTNTTNNLGTALPLALVVPSSNNLYFSLDRTYTLKSGNTLESFPTNSSAPTDEVATTTAISNTAFNPAVDNYFIVAIQPNNAGDSFKQTLCYITLMKAKTSI